MTDIRGRQAERRPGRMVFAAVLAILTQAGLGIGVNLYVTVPAHHPGSKPSDYFAGSYHSVVWAIGNGATALAAHAALGLGLVVLAVGVAARAIRLGRRAVMVWSVLGGLLVIGAGFNGASFLDFGHDTSSLIMALLSFAAIACYAAAQFLLGRTASWDNSGLSAAEPRSDRTVGQSPSEG
jgi:hypothetical protein